MNTTPSDNLEVSCINLSTLSDEVLLELVRGIMKTSLCNSKDGLHPSHGRLENLCRDLDALQRGYIIDRALMVS
jgi:hypothetical protein